MQAYRKQDPANRLIFLLLLTFPLLVLFLLPIGRFAGLLSFWLFSLFTVLMIWTFIGRPSEGSKRAAPASRPLAPEEYPEFVRASLDVEDAVEMPRGVRAFRGILRG